jgi:uncharacterized membrane protein YkoI
MKLKRLVGMLEINLLLVMLSNTAFAFAGARYQSQANVSLTRARSIALQAFAGEIESEELEKESGGSGLRYSFVIYNKNVRHEVGVDAKSGEVLENSLEGPNPD